MPKVQNIGIIDFFRGIAIIMVLLYHTQIAVYPNYDLRRSLLNITPFAIGGDGVILFFIISGFVIHFGYLKSNTKLNYILFFNKRFWRIVPPYYLALAFFAFCLKHDYSNLDIWFHFIFIHNFDETTFFTINPSFWTIAIEVQFYLLYPLLLTVISKIGFKKILFLISLSSIVVFFYCIFFKNYTVPLVLCTSILNYWIIWCLGAFLGLKYFNNEKIFNSKFSIVLLLTMSIYIVNVVLFFVNIKEVNFIYKMLRPFVITFYLVYTIEYFLYFKINNPNLYSYFIGNPTIVRIYKSLIYLGTISYSIYLLHQPLLEILIKYISFGKLAQIWGGFKVFDISLVLFLIFIVSYSYYNLIELFFIKLGKLFYGYYKKFN